MEKSIKTDNKNMKINIDKTEKRGLRFIMLIYLFTWIGILSGQFWISLMSWVAMGLIGFSLWRILEGLIERGENQ